MVLHFNDLTVSFISCVIKADVCIALLAPCCAQRCPASVTADALIFCLLSLIGYALMPAGRSDLSDSSEISSRSSIVSNCSVDSAPTVSCPSEAPGNTPADGSQPCTSSSSSRHSTMRDTSFTLSTSAEELTVPEHTSASEMADSGRGSWTSCSSNSHDNLQTLPGQRALDLLNHRHTPMGGPIAEVEIGPGLPEDSCSRDGSELSQSRQSWTSSSSLSDTYEGSYGTIKRKAADHAASDGQHSTDASYKMITSSTEKGLIVYCVTSPCKDDRFKAPPPTPPGYQGLSLGDAHVQDGGALRPAHIKPPDYSVALQRCKLRHSLAEPNLSRPPSVTLHPHADSEEDEQVSAV